MKLESFVEKVPRISIIYQKRLKKLGIETVHDLLFHFPHRYEDFSNITPISEALLDTMICIKGKIIEIENIRTWHKKITITQAIIEDKSGSIRAVWFNQPYIERTLTPESWVCLAGKVALRKDELYLSNPIYEKIGKKELVHTARIIAVYPTTAGLSSRWLRYILKPLLLQFKSHIPELLPEQILKKERLMPISQAIWQIHFPDSLGAIKQARRRFSFEQLLIIQLLVLGQKIAISQEKAIQIPIKIGLLQDFSKSLPFQLTDAQRKAAWLILKNMEKAQPMSRLLQGDVGSGKTIVALMAILNTIKSGHQAGLMAPTEILAKQHFETACRFFKTLGINIGLVTGSINQLSLGQWKQNIEISRDEILSKIKNGDVEFLIGTHALIHGKMEFKSLALVVLDEQHRFGVEQRDQLLRQPETIPHLLSMTATPIPRSLALSIYGNLNLSVIDEMPKDRKKIITKLVFPKDKDKSYDFISQQVKKGRQAFVICPRIEPNENNLESSWAETKTVKQEFEELSKNVFPNLKLAMLHGKIKPKEKTRIMHQFQKGTIDILVSTSVVEVGIDIPNASVIVIKGADKFGLSQLHQFRGRVGRSKYQSYCLLFADSNLTGVRERLKILMKHSDGLELAEQDLKIRGAGDFLGQRQSGIPDLAMASFNNIQLVKKTRAIAKRILISDSGLKKHPLLKERVDRFEEKIHLE